MFTDYTGAIERRRVTIEFSRRITDDDRADWDRQGGESAVLHQEIPGVVNWALALTREEVNRRMKEPPAQIRRANTAAMQHSNPVADWLLARVVPDQNSALLIGGYQEITVSTRTGEMETETRKVIEQADTCAYPNYRDWCGTVHRAPVSTRRFSPLVMDIARTLGASVYKARINSGMYIKGLRLRHKEDVDRDFWAKSVGSTAKSVGSVVPSLRDFDDRTNTCVRSVGSVGKPSPNYSYSARDEKNNSSPLAQTILATVNGTPMLREDLERAVSLAHGKAGPALIKATIDRLVLSGALGVVNGRLVAGEARL
jgi:putative DNA primase/helicase